ncbi:DUF2306 domain-containing protein [Spirosoma rigui]|uniref:DUF2306 domain-containing protein n=1 Tax=Spirosoma rigui TaxID=564064 RepID=UPI0009B0DD84|nr:DUF2306 domain-containing protein [Spirosoma rigui]
MNTVVISLLMTHIATGSLALLVGLIPMFSRKGNRLHKQTGLVFVYCMIVVAITALLLCALQPVKMMRLFLTGIAVFSFYLTMTGWRATQRKTTGPGVVDWILAYATLAVSVAMTGYGAYLLLFTDASFFPVVFSFFGVLTGVFARKDIAVYKRPVEKLHWFFQHITRMGGAYIATFTAALVTNMDRLIPANSPDWIITAGWIAPSIVGGMLIARTVQHYVRNLKAAKPALV